MANNVGNYAAARQQLISFLQNSGFRAHPNEVYCPSPDHCWVDVAAIKQQDYWAFEYKSRNDSIRRGLEQCTAYATAFNYVVIVADRFRVTSSPYFFDFKNRGFGVWRHHGDRFYTIINPKRQPLRGNMRPVLERQFRELCPAAKPYGDSSLFNWMP